MNVLTTSEVVNQQNWCNEPTLQVILPNICEQITGKPLPAELVQIIWREIEEGRVTRKLAEEYRRRVMKDRKPDESDDFYQGVGSSGSASHEFSDSI